MCLKMIEIKESMFCFGFLFFGKWGVFVFPVLLLMPPDGGIEEPDLGGVNTGYLFMGAGRLVARVSG